MPRHKIFTTGAYGKYGGLVIYKLNKRCSKTNVLEWEKAQSSEEFIMKMLMKHGTKVCPNKYLKLFKKGG